MTEPSLLLLIPAYNEERRIEPVLREYARYFQDHYHGKFQLVVVLNGCTDNTLGVVRKVAAEFPTLGAFEFHEPIGKGGALIEGLKLAPLADVIGYVDADGASPPRAVHELVNRIGEADCVIGSRWLPGAVLLGRQKFPGSPDFFWRPFYFESRVRCFDGHLYLTVRLFPSQTLRLGTSFFCFSSRYQATVFCSPSWKWALGW